MDDSSNARKLLAECRLRSVYLLKRNLSPDGVLAASRGARSERRGYAAVFGRDAAICALGMAVSNDAELEAAAATALETLAAHQARNGQIPKFVDPRGPEPDFWYLGCIDSTLWWLIAVECVDRLGCAPRLAERLAAHIDRALSWLLAQEHQRFFLLQQNEASDWADIMPRSGFVLYTNALWYRVKKVFGLSGSDETRASFNRLFHPFSAALPEYRRARLLCDYAIEKAENRDLFLSFVNFSFFGDEGDVLGNVLAIVGGAADEVAAGRTLDALLAARVHDAYPVRAVVRPIRPSDRLWRPYMARHRQNFAWQYHNGGIWPMVGAFWVIALARAGRDASARAELVKLARACSVEDWLFTEWFHGRTLRPCGMPGQSWNAAGFLLAQHVLSGGADPFVATRNAAEAGMELA